MLQVTKQNSVHTDYSFFHFKLSVSSFPFNERCYLRGNYFSFEILDSYSVDIKTHLDPDGSVSELADVTVRSYNFHFTFFILSDEVDDFLNVAPFQVEVI